MENNIDFKNGLSEFLSTHFRPSKKAMLHRPSMKCGPLYDEILPTVKRTKETSSKPNGEMEDYFKRHHKKPFYDLFFEYLDAKNLDEVEVYKKARVSKQSFSKLKCDQSYRPNKKTAIAYCFGLELEKEEALKLLRTCGYTLSDSSYFDLIISYYLEKRVYDIDDLNQSLYDNGQDILAV